MSIRKSLYLSIITSAIFPLIFMTILTYMISYNKYSQLAKTSAADLANTYADGFETHINLQIAEVEGLANVSSIQNIVLESYNGVAMGQKSKYYDQVQQLLSQTSIYTNNTVHYYLYDINGYYIASTDNSQTADWEEYMNISVSDVSHTQILKSSNINKNNESIEIVSPIKVKDIIVGLLRVNIDSSYFGAFIPNHGEAFIMTENGDYLFSSTGFSNEEMEKAALSNLIHKKQNGYISKNKSSVSNIYGYKYIEAFNWLYIIKQEGAQYKNLVSTLPTTLIFTVVILIIYSVIICRILAKRYTEPIYVLNENMKLASSGDLDVACQITSNDEFGELSNSFNNMMDIISSNYKELDASKKTLEDNEKELRKNYAHIEKLAYHDSLTGLYNRVAFLKYAYNIFHENGSHLAKHAIFFLDLDNFKNVNDTLGHDYGDLLLKNVSNILTENISENDLLARTGGDEFLILKNSYDTIDELNEFAKKIVTLIRRPFLLDDEYASISLSLGISLFPKDGLTISELIKNADIAMYCAKNSGKNSYRFFDSIMADDFNRKNNLADILSTVIENKEIYLLYQPQINVMTGKVTGYEALMRINSKLIGNISPTEFIPIAEDNGIINKLGDWALYEACTFNNNLIKLGYNDIKVSVNVSTSQLKDDHLITIIDSIPEITGMSLSNLELEITESVLMTAIDHNLELINKFKEKGISIALDDFGTGYSSFNYLTQIPIDTLKIDKSFVDRICDNDKDQIISDSIISLSHNMNISVVAEGVEQNDQYNILKTQKCDTIQGYYYSKPLTAEEFILFLQRNN